MTTTVMKPKTTLRAYKGTVFCPMCTHTVPATVLSAGRAARVAPGQKCPRCNSTLDAGSVLQFDQAA